MNRRDRRAFDAQARKASVSRETSIHEAGHAVGRLLTSVIRGIEPKYAVSEITVGSQPYRVWGRQHEFRSLATCYGPMLSSAFEESLKAEVDLHSLKDMGQLYDALASKGDPVGRRISMLSNMLITVMGPAAEARHKGLADAMLLFRSPTCEDDRLNFWRCCKVLGLDATSAEERIFFDQASEVMRRSSVWHAANAIADELKADLDGEKVASIAWPILSRDLGAFVSLFPLQYSPED